VKQAWVCGVADEVRALGKAELTWRQKEISEIIVTLQVDERYCKSLMEDCVKMVFLSRDERLYRTFWTKILLNVEEISAMAGNRVSTAIEQQTMLQMKSQTMWCFDTIREITEDTSALCLNSQGKVRRLRSS